MNLDQLPRYNPKDSRQYRDDYRRRRFADKKQPGISRSSSDVNDEKRSRANLSRSSSNIEKRSNHEALSPLGRIPEADYPVIPRARSANPLSVKEVSKES